MTIRFCGCFERAWWAVGRMRDGALLTRCGVFGPVENSNKNYKNFVQKVVDVSIFWEYYRDSS